MQHWRKYRCFTGVAATEDVSTLIGGRGVVHINRWEGCGLGNVAHDMDKWWVLANTVLTLQFP